MLPGKGRAEQLCKRRPPTQQGYPGFQVGSVSPAFTLLHLMQPSAEINEQEKRWTMASRPSIRLNPLLSLKYNSAMLVLITDELWMFAAKNNGC